jgi:cytochrome c oxidase accessory protein FixG
MSSKKLVKKATKHFVWIAFALWTGFTFVGYFTPIRELSTAVVNMGLGPWETFWIGFYGFATYGNAGFMREQVCKYMCPYARFQSAMFDDDTLIVTYDEARGEPRGSRSRKADLTNQKLGSCIDCSMCVQVCPTGIDIRKGLQYECIGCGACADVCDTVMDKMGYERGLVKYSTQTAMTNGWSHAQMLKRILRPRVMIYATVLILLVVTLLTSLWLRSPFKVDVIRDRGVMARLAEGGMLENVYRLQIMNATESTQHYQLKATGLDQLVIQSDILDANHTVAVNPAESRGVPVRLQIPDGSMKSGSHTVIFEIKATGSNAVVTEKSIFLVPR